MRNRTRTLLPCILVVALAGCRSEGDGTSVAELRAESRLAAATADAAEAVEENSKVTLRRLWAGEYRTFRFSSISPDGRYLSMVDWSTIDLAVRDLRTGELHRLTNVHWEAGEPYEDAGASLFSPDGRRILYVWQRVPVYQLRIMDFEPDEAGIPPPAEPTVVFHNPEFEPFFPFDWSPDGSRILANAWLAGGVNHDHTTNQLALISAADGTYRPLKSFDWREPLRAEFSPDGRYVAYDFPPELDSSNRDLFVVSLDGTHEAPIVDDPAMDRLLGWHPDGSILFLSDRGGTPGIWRVPISDGGAAGPPQLVKADMWGVEPLGIVKGRFYYGVNANPPRLYTASVDLEAGRLTSAPVAVADPARIQVRGWDWSPGGELLAYSGTTRGASGSMIGILSAGGEEIKVLRMDFEATSEIRWDSDGKSLVAFTTDSKGRRGFFRIDLESGSFTTILRADELERTIQWNGHFALSPDGETLYFAVLGRKGSPDSHLELVSYHLPSGEMSHLGTVGWPGRVAIGPDGAGLAVVSPGSTWKVATIPVTGGPVRELYEIPEDTHVYGLQWTPDGRTIVFSTRTVGREGLEEPVLWRVPVAGGDSRRIYLVDHLAPRFLRLHPDGRRIAFMAGESRGEVWVMEGLGERTAASKEEGGPR